MISLEEVSRDVFIPRYFQMPCVANATSKYRVFGSSLLGELILNLYCIFNLNCIISESET